MVNTRNFQIPQTHFSKIKLEDHGSKIKQSEWYVCFLFFVFFFFVFFLFFLFLLFLWAAPATYGDSQAKGLIGAAATGPRATAMRDPSRVCNLHHISRQRRIVNPLSNLMVPSRIC